MDALAGASLAQGEFDANAVYRPRPPDKGSAMPAPAPGGGLVRHPCARGCKIAHAFGYKCDVEVECNTCGSDNHIDDYCWIKHGLKAHNLRLPPVVAEQYEKWHQQQLKGEYVKVPGGPPRVRLGRTARPQSAPSSSSLATISEDEDEYNGLYCGSAADDAHEPIKWVQAVRVQSASITAKRPLATFTFPSAGMVESFGASEVEVVSRYGHSIKPSVARRADADAALAAEETAAAERRRLLLRLRSPRRRPLPSVLMRTLPLPPRRLQQPGGALLLQTPSPRQRPLPSVLKRLPRLLPRGLQQLGDSLQLRQRSPRRRRTLRRRPLRGRTCLSSRR